MSITSITIENFKGIRDKVKIDLKPITLLFGPNSAGKSTIIQALHYAWEVIGRHNLDPNFTEFGGREMDLGGFENLVYGHDLSRSISIRLDMDLTGKVLPVYGEPDEVRYWEPYDDRIKTADGNTQDGLINLFRWHISNNEILNAWVEFKVSWSESTKKFQISSYEVGFNDEIISKIKAAPDNGKVNITYINFFHPLLLIEHDEHEGQDLYWLKDLISTVAKKPDIGLDNKIFPLNQYNRLFVELGNLDKEFSSLDEKLEPYLDKTDKTDNTYKFDQFCLVESIQKKENIKQYTEKSDQYDEKLEQFNGLYRQLSRYEFFFVCAEVFGIQSIHEELEINCLGIIDALPKIDISFDLLKICLERPTLQPELWCETALDSALKQFTLGPLEILREELAKIHYLGPIRSRIPRNYIPNRYVEKRNWPDGLAAWDVLHKEEEEIVKQTDHWMADRLNSGYHITRKTYKEIDVSQIAQEQENILAFYNSAPAKTRLFLMDQKSGVEVQPPDVGVGISQVIPVIVSALYFKEGIVSIEQPELHIHPALQVTLGDLFISQIQKSGPCFILETHSEHMLLRLLRRIRETHENKLPDGISGLSPDQLIIHYIESGPDGVKISTLEIDETGEFKDEWPHGFFEEREEELFY